MNKKVKDIFMYALAGLIMLLLFLFVVVLIFRPIPVENKELLYLATGLVLGWGTSIIGYFFGSSKGSADKTDQMMNNAKPSQ